MHLDSRLAPAVRLALAWQPVTTRPALEALFALDARLGEVVARIREPMLAQIRLAWWRERLAELGSGAPPAEPLLAALAATWGSQAHELCPLVDGWEARLGDETGADELADGRARALEAYAALAGASADAEGAAEAGRRWSHAEIGAGEGPEYLGPLTISPRMRGVAVLGGLATRALARGEPLLAGRPAILAAWRLGLFGR